MRILSYITYFLCIITIPFSVFAEETIVGKNLGLDFYSRIDESGDALASGILKQKIQQKSTYGALGCKVSWLDGERINQENLNGLRRGEYTPLLTIARKKNVNLTTDILARVSSCLLEKYDLLEKDSYNEGEMLETLGNAGLYMDGDTTNSDYDIVTDITRINSIIFKEKYDYNGTKNTANKAIGALLDGKARVGPLFVDTSGNTAGTNEGVDILPLNADTQNTASGDIIPPWANFCRKQDLQLPSASLFGDDFFQDLSLGLTQGSGGQGIAYSPVLNPSQPGASDSLGGSFGVSGAGDFYHTRPCSGIFCITLNTVGGNQNLLGGFANTSIEALLEKHITLMDPISWTDLSAQKMTNNSYQLPWLNIKIKGKIAGLRTYITEVPQIKKVFPEENTQETKDTELDALFRCAMNQVGLPGDKILVNGFIGAGYTGLKDTTTVVNRTQPLGPQETDNLSGCYRIRMNQPQKTSYDGLATDFGEIQSFTRAMLKIITEILDTDTKLDSLPTK